jgi:hypothetical protein
MDAFKRKLAAKVERVEDGREPQSNEINTRTKGRKCQAKRRASMGGRAVLLCTSRAFQPTRTRRRPRSSLAPKGTPTGEKAARRDFMTPSGATAGADTANGEPTRQRSLLLSLLLSLLVGTTGNWPCLRVVGRGSACLSWEWAAAPGSQGREAIGRPGALLARPDTRKQGRAAQESG